MGSFLLECIEFCSVSKMFEVVDVVVVIIFIINPMVMSLFRSGEIIFFRKAKGGALCLV